MNLQKLGYTMFALIISGLVLTNINSSADSNLKFGMPLSCKPNEDCWIVNYVDHDPTLNAKDFTCGHRSYNDHNGTDFGLKDLLSMTEGVSVIAAAGGVVTGKRDGMPDRSIAKTGIGAVKGKECGNGVTINHGFGWVTQYCHMKQGSVRVTVGDRVKEGDILGEVGLSGKTEFPHLHFSVRYQNKIVDPFTGISFQSDCTNSSKKPLETTSLWHPDILAKLPYRPMILYNIGIASKEPTVQEIRNGDFRKTIIISESPMLILWVDIFGVDKGDTLELQIVDPDGKSIINTRIIIDKRQAALFRYTGKRNTKKLIPGIYKGIAVLKRPKLQLNETLNVTFEII